MKYENPREIPPVEVCFSFVGGRLRGAIIWYLAQGRPMRYGELKRCLPKTNPKLLSQQLRALESEGVLQRTVYTEETLRVEYALTEFGKSLWPVVQSAHQWGIQYVNGLSEQEAPYTDDVRSIYTKEESSR